MGKHIYEIIRCEQGALLFYEEHLARLEKSMHSSGIAQTIDKMQIIQKYRQSAYYQENIVVNIRIDVYEDRVELSFSEPIKVEKAMYEEGISVRCVEQVRDNPNVKSDAQSFYRQLKQDNEDIFEFLLVDNQGIVKEGARSNFFAVKDGVIYTQGSANVLMGITRSKVVDVIAEEDIALRYRNVYYKDLKHYEAFFITGTSIGVMPISSIDDVGYPSASNETVLKLRKGYDGKVAQEILKQRG